jgi:protein-S-isoprenylcysteine O-methyltransferase Ste14
MKLKILIGSGRKIGIFTLPFLITGMAANILFPPAFSVGGPPTALFVTSMIILIIGIFVWIWTVYLILAKIPKKELIIKGPYSIVKHPLYTGVAFLVIPWIGFLCNTWLGVFLGIVIYIGSRIYSPEEEKILLEIFGERWAKYCRSVTIKWL